MPVASRYEHADEYPQPLVDRMKELGLFGATIPAEYGGLGLDYSTYARIVEELCRGWMSLGRPQHPPDVRFSPRPPRDPGAEGPLAAAHGDRGGARRLLPHRAARRQRYAGDPHDRSAPG